jgi:hypothetical protein
MQLSARVSLALLLCVAGAGVTASVALIPSEALAAESPATIGIRLLEAADASSAQGLESVYIVGDLQADHALTRRLEIFNTSGSSMRITLYPAAAAIRAGAFTYAVGRSMNQLSSWITVARPVIMLAPRSDTEVKVRVSVPKRTTPGERYAVVWAQVSARTSSSGDVQLTNRVGIRVYLSVGSVQLADDFRIGTVTARRTVNGAPYVAAWVLNESSATVRIVGRVTLHNGPGGLRDGPVSMVPLSALPPGDAGQVAAYFDRGLPRGPWRASLRMSNGTTGQVRITELVFPEVPLSSSTPEWRAPLLVSSAFVIALLCLVACRRHALMRRAPRSWRHPRSTRTPARVLEG